MNRHITLYAFFTITTGLWACDTPEEAMHADVSASTDAVRVQQITPTIEMSPQELGGGQRIHCVSDTSWLSDAASGMPATDRFQIWLRQDQSVAFQHERGWLIPDEAAALGLPVESRVYDDVTWSSEDWGTILHYADFELLTIYDDGGHVNDAQWGYTVIMPQLPENAPPCGGMTITCWNATVPVPFTYAPSSGRCTDARGEDGRYMSNAPRLLETEDASCATLEWEYIGSPAAEGTTLHGWDLRGAVFVESQLGPYDVQGAQLEGADLRGLTLRAGSTLSGTVDAHTQLPEADCQVDGDWLFCAG